MYMSGLVDSESNNQKIYKKQVKESIKVEKEKNNDKFAYLDEPI